MVINPKRPLHRGRFLFTFVAKIVPRLDAPDKLALIYVLILMTHDTISTIGTLIFYAVLLTAAFITGRWLMKKERNY